MSRDKGICLQRRPSQNARLDTRLDTRHATRFTKTSTDPLRQCYPATDTSTRSPNVLSPSSAILWPSWTIVGRRKDPSSTERPLYVLRRCNSRLRQLPSPSRPKRPPYVVAIHSARLPRVKKLPSSTSTGVRGLSEAHIGTSITKLSRSLINLSVSLIGSSQTVPALIDSGAMLNFIHDRLVSMLRLPTLPCSPIKVSLADGVVEPRE